MRWVFLSCLALCFACSTPPRLTEEAYLQGLVIHPPYDVRYGLLWKSALRAVQKLGFHPLNSYPESRLVQTELRIKENLEKKYGTKVYIFFEPASRKNKALFVLRICASRFESPLHRNRWKYVGVDFSLQNLVYQKFKESLEEIYRGEP